MFQRLNLSKSKFEVVESYREKRELEGIFFF